MYQQTCPNVYGHTHPETMIYAHCNEDTFNIVNYNVPMKVTILWNHVD